MKSPVPKLWKQIGNQTQKKITPNSKPQNSKCCQILPPKDLCQQNFHSHTPLDTSFGRLQISEIREKNNFQPFQQPRFKAKRSSSLDGIENMLQDIYENQKNKCVISESGGDNEDNKLRKDRKKYIEACVAFKNILVHVKEQIKNIQKSTNSQRQKVKQFQRQLMETYQKKSMELEDKINQQKKQNQIILQKVKQLSHVQLQKKIIQQKLKMLISQYEIKIRDILENNKSERLKYLKSLQDINNQKQNILKQNSQLSQTIFHLQQKLLTFNQQNIKITKQLHPNTQQRLQKSAVWNSPLKKLKSEQASLKNFFKQSPQKSNTSRKIHYQSGIFEADKEQEQRRKTFSHFNSNKLKNYTINILNRPSTIQQQPIILSRTERFPTEIPLNKNIIRVPQRQQGYNDQQNMMHRYESNYHSVNRSLKSSHMLPLNKMKSTEDNKKCYDINVVQQKLNKMRLEIEGEIRHLKCSMSTNS